MKPTILWQEKSKMMLATDNATHNEFARMWKYSVRLSDGEYAHSDIFELGYERAHTVTSAMLKNRARAPQEGQVIAFPTVVNINSHARQRSAIVQNFRLGKTSLPNVAIASLTYEMSPCKSNNAPKDLPLIIGVVQSSGARCRKQ